MSEQLTIVQQNAQKLDACALAAREAFAMEEGFARTFALSAALGDLVNVIQETGLIDTVMPLQNLNLGFRTDKQEGYDAGTVTTALVEATVFGLQPVGNQFNIIASKFYPTKEGFTYLLRKLPGLSDLRVVCHPAQIKESSTWGTSKSGEKYQKIEREGHAKVDVSCVYNGKAVNEELEFCIRVNNGMSQDAVLGKSEAKAKRWLYNYLTGSNLGEAESAAEAQEERGFRDVTPRPAAAAPAAPATRLKPAPMARKVRTVQEVQEVAPQVQDAQEAQENYAAEAPDETEQEDAALDWLQRSLRDSGKTFNALYTLFDGTHRPHPGTGASRREMARFALAVFRDEQARRSMELNGFVLAK